MTTEIVQITYGKRYEPRSKNRDSDGYTLHTEVQFILTISKREAVCVLTMGGHLSTKECKDGINEWLKGK